MPVGQWMPKKDVGYIHQWGYDGIRRLCGGRQPRLCTPDICFQPHGLSSIHEGDKITPALRAIRVELLATWTAESYPIASTP
jgi:hypothetical protein